MNRSSALSTTRCLLILLVAVQNHFYHASANTVNSSTTTCESNQAILQVDLLTDWWPREISWGVVDITNPSPSMAVLSSDVYSGSETFYSYLYCLDRSNCYEFTMNDSWGDGICCSSWGIGEYTVFYDNGITIAEDGEFGRSETSIRFGDGCPNQSPSVALASALPSVLPSLAPSDVPTLSPSVSNMPSTFPLCLSSDESSESSSVSQLPSNISSVTKASTKAGKKSGKKKYAKASSKEPKTKKGKKLSFQMMWGNPWFRNVLFGQLVSRWGIEGRKKE